MADPLKDFVPSPTCTADDRPNPIPCDNAARGNHEMEAVLMVPISDFELSVRSRSCLERAGIRTLGDLTRVTEAELLASKNFGETSLKEVRDVMAAKGLTIGQSLGAVTPAPAPAPSPVPPPAPAPEPPAPAPVADPTTPTA